MPIARSTENGGRTRIQSVSNTFKITSTTQPNPMGCIGTSNNEKTDREEAYVELASVTGCVRQVFALRRCLPRQLSLKMAHIDTPSNNQKEDDLPWRLETLVARARLKSAAISVSSSKQQNEQLLASLVLCRHRIATPEISRVNRCERPLGYADRWREEELVESGTCRLGGTCRW